MEQFKQCEKETKTKAYSKEGLLVAQQKDDAKDTCRTWITKCLDALQQQHDKVEAELEILKAKKVFFTLTRSLSTAAAYRTLHPISTFSQLACNRWRRARRTRSASTRSSMPWSATSSTPTRSRSVSACWYASCLRTRALTPRTGQRHHHA